MRKQRTKDNLHDAGSEGPQSPSVIVAVAGEKRDIDCDYDNVEFAFQSEFDCNLPTLFNQVNNKKSFDLFVYLGEQFSFADRSSLSNIVDWFWQIDLASVGAIYTDLDIYHGNKRICTKLHPTYSNHVINDMQIINSPLIVKTNVTPEFKEDIDYLSLWDGFLWLSKYTLIYHMPKIMFTVNDKMDMVRLQKDMELIKKYHYDS